MKRTVTLFGLAVFISIAGCDRETSLPPYTATIFLQDFEQVQNDAPLTITGWTAFNAEDIAWHGEIYKGNGYAAFENILDAPTNSWLVSPAINLGQEKRTLTFLSAQHHLTPESSLQVFIATNYNGNPETADWIPLEAVVADTGNQWYAFIPSGEISLEGYSGIVHIGFKASVEIQGAYFLDNVKVY